MSLKHCLILPHGFSLIASISGEENERFNAPRQSIEKLVKLHNLNTCKEWLVVTPHGVRVHDQLFFYDNASYHGSLQQFGKRYEKSYKQSTIIKKIIEERMVGNFLKKLIYGAESGIYGVAPLDWGVLIPLHFVDDCVNIGVISMDRYDKHANDLVSFGSALCEAFEEVEDEIGIILSSDFGHCHNEDGIGGYHKDSERLDAMLMETLRRSDFTIFDSIDEQVIENGKSDAIGQMQIARGILGSATFDVLYTDYYVPTYFGLPIAYYRRNYEEKRKNI